VRIVVAKTVAVVLVSLAFLVPLGAITACGSGPAQEDSVPPEEVPLPDEEPLPPDEEPVEDCDPSYPDSCIPPPPPDLDCVDVGETDFTVEGDDPHGFDADGDGVGCESY
jgi:hypothetical protein